MLYFVVTSTLLFRDAFLKGLSGWRTATVQQEALVSVMVTA
jgi:hypothetical protein